jgi:hypothetical protein
MPKIKPSLSLRPVFLWLASASIVIGLSSGENWLLRATAEILFLLGAFGFFVSFVISRNFGFIGPRLRQASLRGRLLVEIMSRLMFLGAAAWVAPPLFYGVGDVAGAIKRGYPTRAEVTVVAVEPSAMWSWVWKSITLQTADGSTTEYNVFFHPQYPELGQRYEVALFPKSKCILSLQPIDQ